MKTKKLIRQAIKLHPNPKIITVSTMEIWLEIVDGIGCFDDIPVYIFPPLGDDKFYIQ